MGTYVKKWDKDYMKMAILKQEETFRHQVHELHRLYRVQKLLMNDMKAELNRERKPLKTQRLITDNETESNQTRYSHQKQKNRRPCPALDLELPAEEYIDRDRDEGSAALEVAEEENDLELTLATGSSSGRKKESSITSDSGGASFSSSSNELNGGNWGLFQVPDVNVGSYRSERKISFSVDDQMREERMKQPPWLFQCLSLNMTG